MTYSHQRLCQPPLQLEVSRKDLSQTEADLQLATGVRQQPQLVPLGPPVSTDLHQHFVQGSPKDLRVEDPGQVDVVSTGQADNHLLYTEVRGCTELLGELLLCLSPPSCWREVLTAPVQSFSGNGENLKLSISPSTDKRRRDLTITAVSHKPCCTAVDLLVAGRKPASRPIYLLLSI